MSRLTNKKIANTEKGYYITMQKVEYLDQIKNAPTYGEIYKRLSKYEDLMEKYEIEDLAELEIALDQYYHRYDNVQTRRVNDNGKY